MYESEIDTGYVLSEFRVHGDEMLISVADRASGVQKGLACH